MKASTLLCAWLLYKELENQKQTGFWVKLNIEGNDWEYVECEG